jgi:DNA polymerase
MFFSSIKNFLFLDFETYYGDNYTLRKMTIPEYLLDPRYETICCATAVNFDQPSVVVDGPDFSDWLSQWDPETTATVTFNALFDNAILAWHYGWAPKLMFDSMNMARALRGHILPRLNLETVCKVFHIQHDKSTILRVKNMRREDIILHGTLWEDFCRYANGDNEASRTIFKTLLPEFPQSEWRVMDLVIRACIRPRFMLDRTHLQNHLTQVRNEKINLLNACGAQLTLNAPSNLIKAEVARIGLMSQVGFTKALEAVGVLVQTKTSPATGKQTPAFAKTDAFMTMLQEHPDARVQALACARLGIKSTLEETRTERLIAISGLSWSRYRDGNPRLYSGGEMPVPLRYSGAHTHRLSGDWKLNLQNLPRGLPGKPSALRKALIAPAGHTVIAGDLAQIEARLVAWLAKCTPLLHEFSIVGGDPYSAFASIIFGFAVNAKLHPLHRFIGKTGVLGLGYQCGVDHFFQMVQILARLQGIDLAAAGIKWTPDLARKTVWGYRERYHHIRTLWTILEQAIASYWSNPLYIGDGMRIGPVLIRYGEIEGPNALKMHYHLPQQQNGEYGYTYGWGHYKMYGGKMLENIIQFLARIIIMNAACRLADLGYEFALQSHDELVFIVPQSDEANALAIIKRELIRPPSWARDLSLDAAVKSGPSYGDAK